MNIHECGPSIRIFSFDRKGREVKKQPRSFARILSTDDLVFQQGRKQDSSVVCWRAGAKMQPGDEKVGTAPLGNQWAVLTLDNG